MGSTLVLAFDSATTVTNAGITVDSGTWVLNSTDRATNEPSSPSTSSGPNKTLEQTDTTAALRRVAHITNNPDAPIFEFDFEMKIFSDGTTFEGGILFRGAIGSGYALSLNASSNTITLWDTVGQWKKLQQIVTVSTSNNYVTTNKVLRVSLVIDTNSLMKVFVNGILSVQATDTSHNNLFFGFYTLASHCWFDNILITSKTMQSIVNTTDWIKGSSLYELKETGANPTLFAYDTPNANNSLANLITTNVNAVMLVVPARMTTITSTDVWWDWTNNNNATINPNANDLKLQNMTGTVHGYTYIDSAGQTQQVKVMWNLGRFLMNDGNWRGDLAPTNKSLWWTNYKAFVVHYATLAGQAGVEYLMIGSELRNLEGGVDSTDVTNWLDLISQVRAVYAGIVIYSVQWSNLQSVMQTITNSATWLNNVDYVGVSAYFELVGSYTVLTTNVAIGSTTVTLPTGEGIKYVANTQIQIEDSVSAETNYIQSISNDIITLSVATANAYTVANSARIVEDSALSPSLNDLIRGWDNGRAGDNPFTWIQTISTTYGKPIVFTEIGYRSMMGSSMFPWAKIVPPNTKPTAIANYETNTANSWGWLSDNIMRDRVNEQEIAYAAAITRWWTVSWMHGMFISGWTANPNDGFSTATKNAFFDADYTPQNKTAQAVMSNLFSATNVRQNLVIPTTYTTPHQVALVLGVPDFTATTTVPLFEVLKLIQRSEAWVDLITRSSWKSQTVTELYEFTTMGIKLRHDPIQTVSLVQVFNGQTFETKKVGRNLDYWVDFLNGTIYFTQDPLVQFVRPIQLYTFRGWGQYKYPVQVTYTHGRFFQASGVNPRDPFAPVVEDIATKWVAIQLARSNDFSVLFPSGTDKVTLEKKIEQWEKDFDLFRQRQEKLTLW